MAHTLCIGITRECNWNKCTYCHVQKDPVPNRWEYIQPILDYVLTELPDIRTVKFFGGEPLLMAEEMKQVMDYMEKRRGDRVFQYDVNTNGLLLTADMVEALRPYPMRFLLSVDGGMSTLARGRHYGREEFAQLRQALHLLRERHMLASQVQINVAIAPECAGELVQNILELYQSGARLFNLLPAFYVRWSAQQLEQLASQFTLLAQVFQKLPELQFINMESYAPMPLFCDHVVLDVDGRVYSSMIIFEGFFRKYMEHAYLGSYDSMSGVAERLQNTPTNFFDLVPLPEAVRYSTRAVDQLLTAFVEQASLTPAAHGI